MALELWMQGGGHWFVETDFGDVVAGQAEKSADGTWSVEVNDKWFFDIPDLEAVSASSSTTTTGRMPQPNSAPAHRATVPPLGRASLIVMLRTTRSPFRRPSASRPLAPSSPFDQPVLAVCVVVFAGRVTDADTTLENCRGPAGRDLIEQGERRGKAERKSCGGEHDRAPTRITSNRT